MLKQAHNNKILSSVWSREYFDYLSCFSLSHMTTSPPPHVLIKLVQQAIKERAISCNNGRWFMLFVHHHGTHQYAMFYTYFTHWFFFYLHRLCNNAVCIKRHSSANWGTNPTYHTVTEKCHETLSFWISIVLGNIWTTHIMNTSLELSYYATLCSIKTPF
jgi:hypothetical protein